MQDAAGKERITAYLSYLRDVSRKIGLGANAGFEKCLLQKKYAYSLRFDEFPKEVMSKGTWQHYPQGQYSKNAKQKVEALAARDALYYPQIAAFYRILQKAHTEKLFAGFGLIAGYQKRLFAAPVILAACEIDSEDESLRSIKIEPDITTLRLNYDLITALVDFDGDSGNFDPNQQEIKDILDTYEHRIEEIIKKGVFDSQRLSALAKEVFEQLRACIAEFKAIQVFDGKEYDLETELQNLGKTNLNKNHSVAAGRLAFHEPLFKGPLVFVEADHLFINPVPSQLSTYEALHTFTVSVTSGSFANPVLEKMLINGITEKTAQFNQENLQEKINTLIMRYVPLPLSEPQVQSIINAWENEISYIQGPPGTGKSHTISALILTAQAMNKKVLVLSQKPAALQVVKNKAEPLLSANNEHIMGICYYDKDARRSLRDYCKQALDRNFDDSRNKQAIDVIKKTIAQHETDLDRLQQDLDAGNAELKTLLEAMREHNERNEELTRGIKEFDETFRTFRLPRGYAFKIINNAAAYKAPAAQIKRICAAPYDTLSAKLYRQKIQNHLAAFFALERSALINIQLDTFFEQFINLNILFTQVKALEREAGRRDIYICRRKIEAAKKKIKDTQQKIIILKTELVSREKASRYSEGYDELDKLSKMLRFVNPRLIDEAMQKINYHVITDILPFWAAEIRSLGHLFPLESGLFDVVVVDEASQVNLAEIIPAFYRGKRICIVGDHKQLSLEATGLNFALNNKIDEVLWGKYVKFMPYAKAKEKNLVVKKASILDFIRSGEYQLKVKIAEKMLDEHFRSLPHLANWTSSRFYSGNDTSLSLGGLKIMTETPEKMHINCFKPVKVNGIRKGKIVTAEAEKVVAIIRDLTSQNGKREFALPPHIINTNFSIGVISMLRDQVELIKDLLNEEFPDGSLRNFGIDPDAREGVGTPEEFQGNERDIMILSLCLDADSKAIGHFQNPQRLNVATSRAKQFTYFVYSEIPGSFDKIKDYSAYMSQNRSLENKLKPFESDFERYVYKYLERYVEQRSQYKITLHNQVKAAGQKRLDFVLYNRGAKKSAAIEVDGRQHYQGQIKHDYTIEHIQRMETLCRAGWNIINTPYYKWYDGGWLCNDNNPIWQEELDRIYRQLDSILEISVAPSI
jgi:septal ring factor EnvC (AmiA/AmiB activator)